MATDHTDSIIVGDVNFHLDSDSNTDACWFKDSLSACGLRQHVNEPTHQKSHILDVVITKDSGNIIDNLEVTDPALCDKSGNISGDYYAISFSAHMSKPRPNRKVVTFRQLRTINVNSFKEHIRQNNNLLDVEAPLDELITNYKSLLDDIINLQTPLLNRTITLRLNSSKLRDAKHKRRELECRWRSTKLEVRHQLYREFYVEVNKSLRTAKTEYYESQIEQCRRDTKAMFRTMNADGK